MITRTLSLSALGLIACAACATEPPAETKRPIREMQLPGKGPKETAPASTQQAPLPPELLAKLQADAMKRASVAEAQVAVVSSERVVWPNGALGCAQPGQMYTQALVPGYRVTMKAGGRVLVYHTNESGSLTMCPAGSRSDPMGPTVAE